MFQAGQKVVCINDSFSVWVYKLYKALPKKGEVYTVRDVRMGLVNPEIKEGKNKNKIKGDYEVVITLEELKNDICPFEKQNELAFNCNRFRALEETNEVIKKHEEVYA